MVKSEQIVDFVHWLEKMRRKLVLLVAIPALATIVMFFNAGWLIKILAKPLHGLPLYFKTPVEGFTAKLEVAFFGGVIFVIPVLAYLLISLTDNLMPKRLKRTLYWLALPFATLAFYGGIVFGYFLILPTTVKFLLNCGNEFMKPILMGNDYFSFTIFVLITIGLVFELPLILVLLSRTGVITSRSLMKKRRMAVIIILIVLAIVTPTPDAFTLFMVSLPMLILYEISIWWIYLLEKGIRRRKADQDTTE